MTEQKNLRIGEFIAEKLAIPEGDLKKMLNMQEYLNEKIGEIAIRKNLLNQVELKEVLALQKKHQISFGNAAIYLGFMRSSQVSHLLDVQARSKERLGDLLVKRGLVKQEKFLEILDEFNSHRDIRFTILAFVQESLSKKIDQLVKPYHYPFHYCAQEEELLPLVQKLDPQLVLMDKSDGDLHGKVMKIREALDFKSLRVALFSPEKESPEPHTGYEYGVDYVLHLPFESKELLNVIIDAEIQTREKRTERILVVDDSPIARGSVAQELGDEGFKILFAENGKEAVEIATLEKPDLITMDINMPVMDGYQSCLQIKSQESTAQTPIIILTTNNTREEREKGFEVGAVEYFTKPFTKGHLSAYVKHLLSGKEIRDEKIIVAEDSQIYQNAYKTILGKSGFRCEIVDNGRKVLDLLDGGFEASAILLDRSMPVMDGLEACQKLKEDEKYRHIPVILVTGAKEKDDILNGLRIGANDYILKPFDGDELMARMEAHVKNYSLFKKLQKQNNQLCKSEESLLRAKEEAEAANKLKDKFVSLVAHDLRSPFTSILGFLEFVLDDQDDPLSGSHQEMLQMVYDKGKGLVKMINDLLEVGRLKMGKLKPNCFFMDAHSTAEEILGNFGHLAEGKGVRLVNEVPQNTRVYADSQLYQQVTQNLVTNAIKFCHEGDTITLFVPPKEAATIAVKDTGVGIKKELQEKLFQYEESTSTTGTSGEEGTGFGLPLSRDIMKAHGGSLDLESKPGKGSTFYARLPVVLPTILLVDDDRKNRILLKEVLKPLGVKILEAENGQKALQVLAKTRPNLVITDNMMPVMGGFDLLKAIRKDPSLEDLTVVFITADTKPETRESAFHLMANDFINRPFDRNELVARVKRFIE